MLLFYYTLAILLIVAITGTICFCVNVVTHIKAYLYATCAFFFYFLDVALVFRNDFLHSINSHLDLFNKTSTPFEFVIFGGAVYLFYWLVITNYLNKMKRSTQIIPTILFCVLSIILLIIFPENNLREFLFFSVRTLLMFWSLIYIALHYHRVKSDPVERERLLRYKNLFWIILIGSIAVLLENIVFFFIFKPGLYESGYISFMPERNVAENFLMLGISWYMCHDGLRILSLYHQKTPIRDDFPNKNFVASHIDHYAKSHSLSSREKEILLLIMVGKSNSKIAQELSLSQATVKVHIHNILSKTHQANRVELSRDFWKRS